MIGGCGEGSLSATPSALPKREKRKPAEPTVTAAAQIFTPARPIEAAQPIEAVKPDDVAKPDAAELNTVFSKKPGKAKKKKSDPPTSQHTISRIAGLIAGLGANFSDYQHRIPKIDKDAKALAARMAKKYHELKGAGTLPPTAKQIAFARSLSKSRNVALPTVITRQSISDFISTWKGAYMNTTPYEDAEIMPPVTAMPF